MKMQDRFLMFREEPTDGGGGGDGDGGSKGAAVFEEPGQQRQDQQQQQQQQAAPPTATVDAAALAEKFGEQLKGVLGERGEQKKELTPEEAKKLLKFPEVTDEWLAKFGDIKTQKQALEEFRDALLTHIHTVNGMTRREMMDELDGRFKT